MSPDKTISRTLHSRVLRTVVISERFFLRISSTQPSLDGCDVGVNDISYIVQGTSKVTFNGIGNSCAVIKQRPVHVHPRNSIFWIMFL